MLSQIIDPERGPLLVIDAANVIGSVPDGWWRDRPGAATRLHEALAAWPQARSGIAQVVLVLEGKARPGVAEGQVHRAGCAPVRTVHAPGAGDDEIVRQCELALAARSRVGTTTGPSGELPRPVFVATADRGLITRVFEVGAEPVGPRSVPRRP